MTPSRPTIDLVLFTALIGAGALDDHRNRRFPSSLAFAGALLSAVGGVVAFVGLLGSSTLVTMVGASITAIGVVGILLVVRWVRRHR